MGGEDRETYGHIRSERETEQWRDEDTGKKTRKGQRGLINIKEEVIVKSKRVFNGQKGLTMKLEVTDFGNQELIAIL